MLRLTIITLLLSITIFSQNMDENNRFFMGQSFEQGGNYARAKEIYEDLYSRNKNNFQFFDALNRVYLLLKEYQSSITIIEERLRMTPDDLNLLGLLGKTYHMSGDEDKAFAAWDRAVENTAGNPAVYKLIANYAIERRSFNKAVELLKKGKESSGEDEMFSFDLGNLYALLMQYENAADEFCSMILKKPQQYNLVEAKILTYINKPEALTQTIEAVEKSEKNNAVSSLLARLYLEARDFEKAYSIYLDLEDSNDKIGSELFKFAQYAFSENEFIYASKAYNEIISRYPGSPYLPNAKLGFAKTLEAGIISGEQTQDWKPYSRNRVKDPSRFDEVISAYQDLIKLYAISEVGLESNYRIGKIKFSYQEKPAEAEEYFYKIVTTSPFSIFAAHAYMELGEIYLVEGDLEKSYESYSKILKNDRAPEDVKKSAEYRTALISFYKGDFLKSREILTGLMGNLKSNSANDAIELSLLMNTTMNDSSNLLIFAEAEMLAGQGKYEEAAGKYKQIAAMQGAFVLQNLAKIREAEMELAVNNTENAVLLLQQISKEKEKNIYSDKALYLLGKIYQYSMEDGEKAVGIYEDLLVRFPNSLYIDEAREEILKLRRKLS